MKSFCLKILIFLIVLLSIICSIKSTVPFYWGNKNLGDKIEFFLEKKYIERISTQKQIECNVLFFGSSRTYRHIQPILFDSITNFKSFNLGGNGTFFLETNYLIDNILNIMNSSDTIRIFQQKTTPTIITDKNFHSVRSKYFLDFKRLKIALKYFLTQKDYKQVYRHIISYVENQICIGELKRIYDYHFTKSLPPSFNLKMMQKGYWPMGAENNFILKTKQSKEEDIPNHFYLEKNISSDSLNVITSILNDDHTNKYQNIISYKITGDNLKKFKLEKKYYYDRGHFNFKGSRIFTIKLAQHFNKL
tara:strand:+ start:1361 stop:2275 length:915 start_codon:yes stop_codon:yes gene_type:complete